MAIRSDAAHEQVDSACSSDGLLIILALSLQVFSITVQYMHILLLDVDMAEEVVPHKRVVALRMLLRQIDILVHIERNHILERNFASLVQVDEFSIQSQRRTSGGATQLEWLLRSRISSIDFGGHIICSPFRHTLVVRFDDDSHGI